MGMADDSRVRLRFWGVRGSIPVPAADHMGHGGNTPCLEVRVGKNIFVIDAGTGARKLGIDLQNEFAGTALELNLLLTHFHWDHIQGLPFFAPLYSADNRVIFHSCHPPEKVKRILEGEMSTPYFPVNFEFLAAKRDFVSLRDGPLRDAGLCVRAFPLHHPQGATGYRIEAGGVVITHASDLEHGHPELDKTLREYAQDADVLIYDSQYTPEEYSSKKGWGHSTWLEATRVARDCKAKRLILFHHDPGHDDARMQEIVKEARGQFDNTDAAREGTEIVF
jgi:phosphoribosyl 1,2-cyclic phosphodiesterase